MQHKAHTAFDDQLPVKALILSLREVVAYGSEPAHLNVRKYTMASKGMSRSQMLRQPVQCHAKQHTPKYMAQHSLCTSWWHCAAFTLSSVPTLATLVTSRTGSGLRSCTQFVQAACCSLSSHSFSTYVSRRNIRSWTCPLDKPKMPCIMQ